MKLLAEKQKTYTRTNQPNRWTGQKEQIKNMQALMLHAKLALYARQQYLTEVTRGIAFVLLVDVIVSILLKRVERHRRRMVRQLAASQKSVYARVKAQAYR